MTKDELTQALKSLKHPFADSTLFELGMLPKIETDSVELELLTPASPFAERFQEDIKKCIAENFPEASVKITVGSRQRASIPALGAGPLTGVKNILAVASGKGGVGKSTVASNLAAAIANAGASVGLLDADIYGPSIPSLLGLVSSPVHIKDKKIQPVEKFGLKIMSMGFLMKPEDSVIWRGPMLHGMMNQFCRDVTWGELDFLIFDLPPGTGDVSLSLSQLVPIGGSVVVSTPQDVALSVATKAVSMFGKLNVPILGLMENMSYYKCPNCGNHDDLFGHGGAQQAAENLGLPFLGEVPLNGAVREAGDAGEPIVLRHPDSAPALALKKIAQEAAERLSLAGEVGLEKVIA